MLKKQNKGKLNIVVDTETFKRQTQEATKYVKIRLKILQTIGNLQQLSFDYLVIIYTHTEEKI